MTTEVTETTMTAALATEVTETALTAMGSAEGMQRYYELAKRQAWDVRGLSWGEIAPVPEGHGPAAKRARRHSMWRSVVTQQLQADMIAVQCSVQLLRDAPDYEAKLYYTTMTQDEARHLEAWLRLSNAIGGTCEPDPHLEKLGNLTMQVETLEETIWLFQVAFEGLVIPRFRQIAAAAPDTILAEICKKLQVDDGIHHGSGVCYERMLLRNASSKTKRSIEKVCRLMWPLYAEHLSWRPRERAWASSMLRAHDAKMIAQQREEIMAMGAQFGMDLDLPQ
ncbi:MAG: ferritin-like domain-containing protein [Ktedonobacterales bacterium]|nr:ferritin-like domain-containing protein [Ktedonobacterales bacterium]